jgi:hypothetical protein
MKEALLAIGLAAAVAVRAQEPGLGLSFSPESEKFAEATKEYQGIWDSEGRKMIEAMESVSGMKFAEREVAVIVFEGVSRSGSKGSPMKLRASYPAAVKKATLIHELGHRLNARLANRPEGVDEHKVLFLYLYDVWAKLYGRAFADEQVAVEKKRKGVYDYETAWDWALSLGQEGRASLLRQIVKENAPG